MSEGQKCAFCSSTERNRANTRMLCQDGDTPCARAGRILHDRFGNNSHQIQLEDFTICYELALKEFEPKSRWEILLADDDLM